MPDSRIHIRRGRRTDFMAVMSLLAASGVSVPPSDRATLRRFRNLVADLGADFYLAVVDGTLAGLVHVTYARQLTALPRACLDYLVVAAPFRRQGIGSTLVTFARNRAVGRGCATFSCGLAADRLTPWPFLEKNGFQHSGEWYVQSLEVPD